MCKAAASSLERCSPAEARQWACSAGRTLASNSSQPPQPRGSLHRQPAPDEEQLSQLWHDVYRAYVSSGGLDVQVPPGERGFGAMPHNDFVVDGLRMAPGAVAAAAGQWSGFLAAAPPYNATLFAGRGIAIGGGGLQYITAAWASLRALRRSGCLLPVEMWFLEGEAPRADPGSLSAPLLRALEAHGAVVRSVQEAMGGDAMMASGYALKPLALLFSAFEEVLWLDADNLALRDPTFLFDSPAVPPDAPLLLWRDFWDGSGAPDAAAILAGGGGEASFAAAMLHTCESGQLLLRKSKGWPVLMLVVYLNLQSPLYYRLLSSYMGMGDKETWPAAAAALHAPAAWVSVPPGALGVASARHADVLLVNAMLQHSPSDGQPLFVHANYFKLTPASAPLTMADALAPTVRRWRLATPVGFDAELAGSPHLPLLTAAAALAAWGDLERAAWADVVRPTHAGGRAPAAVHSITSLASRRNDAQATLFCAPWFEAYAHERRRRRGEMLVKPAACGPGQYQASVAWPGLVLEEHAHGRYRELWEWHLTPYGPRRSRIGQ